MRPVIHVITTIEMGGAEKQLLILATAQVKSGRKVRVCYLKGNPELVNEFKAGGIEILDHLANKNFLIQIYLLRQILSRSNELIHAHLPQAELLAAFAGFRHKLIVTRHNSEPFWPKKPRIVSNSLSRFVSFRAGTVIAISDAVKEYLIQRGEVRKRAKVVVVYYGFSSEILKRPSRESGLIFGTISRLTEQKDLPTMLGAFAKFSASRASSKLYIVGEGHLRANLEKLTYDLEIRDKVLWLGRTSDIDTFLDSLDVFLLTSLYEGFGMVLLEAISRSVPIIASNNDAVAEVLGEDSPSLFSIGDVGGLAEKMKQIQDPDFKENLLTSNLMRIEKFSIPKMLSSLDSIYSNTVKSV